MLSKDIRSYIWITDFKRFTLDLEESENNGIVSPNLFDYMNVNKHYKRKNEKPENVKLLYNGSQKYKGKNDSLGKKYTRNYHYTPRNTAHSVVDLHENIKGFLDNAV